MFTRNLSINSRKELDAGARTKAAGWTNENVQDCMNRVDSGDSSKTDLEITNQWKDEFDKLSADILLPICEDYGLCRYPTEYSHVRLEVKLRSSFLDRALDRIDKLCSDILAPASYLRSPKRILNSENIHADLLGSLACGNLKETDIEDWLLIPEPHCRLGGRVTVVLGASYPEDATPGKLACKSSFPEIPRETKEVSKTEQLSKDLPDIVVYGDMSRYIGTQLDRNMSVQIPITGYRTSRVLVSRKLAPLTSLVGTDFIKAWLELVRSHAFLWTIGVEHGDPGLWDVMYNEDLKCGVLGDYDLSIPQRRPRVPGTDKTGTIPFMAVELLNDNYWEGKIERLYRHELEAFIWILPFVCLRYKRKKPRRGTPVDRWMTSNYDKCRMVKNDFWWPSTLTRSQPYCQPDFKDIWVLAEQLLLWLVFDVRGAVYRRFGGIPETDLTVASLWPQFVEQLRLIVPLLQDYLGELITGLDLEIPSSV